MLPLCIRMINCLIFLLVILSIGTPAFSGAGMSAHSGGDAGSSGESESASMSQVSKYESNGAERLARQGSRGARLRRLGGATYFTASAFSLHPSRKKQDGEK